MPETLHIEIISDGHEPLCQSKCGSDLSQPEVKAQVKIELQEKFGDRVKLDYVDIGNGGRQFGEFRNFPLLIVNGYIRLCGQFDIRQLMEIVETQLEIGASAR
jgi:hypothetical protein